MATRTSKAVEKVEEPVVVPTTIEKLSLDYPSEQLNNLAMKVNEIIDRIEDKL